MNQHVPSGWAEIDKGYRRNRDGHVLSIYRVLRDGERRHKFTVSVSDGFGPVWENGGYRYLRDAVRDAERYVDAVEERRVPRQTNGLFETPIRCEELERPTYRCDVTDAFEVRFETFMLDSIRSVLDRIGNTRDVTDALRDFIYEYLATKNSPVYTHRFLGLVAEIFESYDIVPSEKFTEWHDGTR